MNEETNNVSIREKAKEQARIEFHDRTRPSGNQFDGIFMDGFDAGFNAATAQRDGACKCGHPKARHNFLDETQTSIDGCYPEPDLDCDCNEYAERDKVDGLKDENGECPCCGTAPTHRRA